MLKIPGITAKGKKPQFIRKAITPKLAQQILSECNQDNRRLRPNVVKRWSHQFKLGEWDEWTNQSIAFDEEGVLRDGQHRLHACVNTDVPFETWVYLNMPAKSHKYIDVGAVRTLHDRTQLPMSLTSVLTVKYRISTGNRANTLSYDETMALYKKNKKGYDYAHGIKYNNGVPSCNCALIRLAFAEYHKKSAAHAEDFKEQFYLSIGCAKDSPALALVAYLRTYHTRSLSQNAHYLAAKQAMDAHYKGEDLKLIKITDEMLQSARYAGRRESLEIRRQQRLKKMKAMVDRMARPSEIQAELHQSGTSYAEDMKFLGVDKAKYAKEVKALGKQTTLTDQLNKGKK